MPTASGDTAGGKARSRFKDRIRERREQAILQAVGELLSEKGCLALTMDDVAHRVSVAKGSLYPHAPTRSDLVGKVVERWMDEVPVPSEPPKSGTRRAVAEIAAMALVLGVDVVLDWGFWSRSERDDFRSRAAALGVRAEVRFLDVPRDELSARLAVRDTDPSQSAFRVSDAELDLYRTLFEPPTPDETS